MEHTNKARPLGGNFKEIRWSYPGRDCPFSSTSPRAPIQGVSTQLCLSWLALKHSRPPNPEAMTLFDKFLILILVLSPVVGQWTTRSGCNVGVIYISVHWIRITAAGDGKNPPPPKKKKIRFLSYIKLEIKKENLQDRLFFFILITEITWGWVLPRCDWLKYRLYMPEHSIHPDKLLLSWLLNLNSRPRYQTSLVNLIIISARGDAYEGIDTKTHKGIDTKTS